MRSHRRSGAAAYHALRSHQDGRTTRLASLAPPVSSASARRLPTRSAPSCSTAVSPSLKACIGCDWQRLDQRIHTVSLEIQLLAQQDQAERIGWSPAGQLGGFQRLLHTFLRYAVVKLRASTPA